MLNSNDVAQLYDTILSVPGMNEPVKIDLKISRKNILLLSSVIEKGLASKDQEDSLLGNIPDDAIEELRLLSVDFVQKAGLTEFKEKLGLLQKEK